MRIGLWLWAAAWAYLLYHWSDLPLPAALCLFPFSLVAAFGRVAEGAFVGCAAFPFIFPAHALAWVSGGVLAATGLQWGAWGLRFLHRWRDRREFQRQSHEEWRYHPEEEPVFTRDGKPLNRAAWRQLTPEGFEEEVLELFREHGFSGSLTPLSGDEGIDLDLECDGQYYVAQCKRYHKPVGQAELRDFAGAMYAVGADAGYFVTTSSFTDPAARWAEALDDLYIVLVDGEKLVTWAQEGRLPE